jgi:hypothetical protein
MTRKKFATSTSKNTQFLYASIMRVFERNWLSELVFLLLFASFFIHIYSILLYNLLLYIHFFCPIYSDYLSIYRPFIKLLSSSSLLLYIKIEGFSRLFGLIITQNDALRTPAYGSFAASYSTTKIK